MVAKVEVHQLQVLRELGALGSVTAVADALGVTPSAVSQQLAALQRGFRAPLTRKQGRTLALTDAGQVLAEAGASVIDAIAAARCAVEEFEQAAGGTVTVSGFVSVGQAMFGPLIRELGRDATSPKVCFADEDVAQDDFPPLTASYDLVLAHRLVHGPPWPSAGTRTITLAHEPLDVALPATHRLAERAELGPEDVAGERWVISKGGYSPDDVVGAVAAVANHNIDVVHRINDYGEVSAVIAADNVIGLLPRYTSGHADDDGIVLRPLIGLAASRSVDILARPENLRRRSVLQVVDALRCVMERLVHENKPLNG